MEEDMIWTVYCFHKMTRGTDFFVNIAKISYISCYLWGNHNVLTTVKCVDNSGIYGGGFMSCSI
jgi:hypothetical protein